MSDFTLEFASHWYLLLLVVVPAIYYLSRNSLAGLGGLRRKKAIILRTIAVLCVVLAVSRTRILKENETLAVMFVVDSSDSVQPDVRRGILDYIVDEWQHQRDEHKGDRVGVVLFGKDAGIEISSTEKQLQSSEIKTLINSDGTDMEAAIRLAVAAFPDDVGGKRLVLFTDGNETHGTVLEEIHNAASLGVTVDVVPIYSQRQSEFWLEKVLVDSEAKISEPYNLTVVVGSTVETKARVSVYENDRLLTSPDSIYDLRKGNTRISFPDIRRDKPGFFQYKVRVEPIEANQDTIEKNNTGSAFVLIKGEPKIMYVLPGGSDEIHAEEVKLDAPLLMALAEEKIKVDVIRADFLPRHPQEYVDYDAIVFSNVAMIRSPSLVTWRRVRRPSPLTVR